MKLGTAPKSPHLTYCLNIHPGECWRDNLNAIETHTLQVRDRLGMSADFGLGLRLSAAAAAELDCPATLQAFRTFMNENGLYVFTVNGFPYGNFHGSRVKERAYHPDWTRPERLAYTQRLGRILAALLPERVPGSISTVPGSYRAWVEEGTTARIAENLLSAVLAFAELEARTDRRIALALEPEPDCLWDQAQQLTGLTSVLQEVGNDRLEAAAEAAGMEPQALITRHLGICLDTCHQSVLFEDPGRALRTLLSHGMPIHKLQVSAAPTFECTPGGLDAAAGFVDSVYLHQSCVRNRDGNLHRFPDLPPALSACRAMPGTNELRTHFHIPLVLDPTPAMGTTRQDLGCEFWSTVVQSGIPHIEVETYSFDVLPPQLRRCSVEENVAGELSWTLHALRSAGSSPAHVEAVDGSCLPSSS